MSLGGDKTDASRRSAQLVRLDLNLLTTLDAILREESVTKAAERMQVSPPTVSANLARLRVHFSDPILARSGNSYFLTPLARRLATSVPEVLDAAIRVFDTADAFDYANSSREFTIAGTDYSFALIGSKVSAHARKIAPGVSFSFVQHLINQDDLQVLRNIDGMLLPHGLGYEKLPHIDIYEDQWVAVASSNNSAVKKKLTMANLAELPWVHTYRARDQRTPIGRQLQTMGIDPKVECVVEGFLALPYFLSGTNRISIVQRSLAEQFIAQHEVQILELPFEAFR